MRVHLARLLIFNKVSFGGRDLVEARSLADVSAGQDLLRLILSLLLQDVGQPVGKDKACVQSQLMAKPLKVYWYLSTHGSLGSGAAGECRRIRAECSSSSCRTASAAALLANSSAARAASTRSRCSLRDGAKGHVTGKQKVPLHYDYLFLTAATTIALSF